MFHLLLKRFEDALLPLLPKDRTRLAPVAKRLSLMLTSERGEGSLDPYFSKADVLDAYLLAFLLPNAAKVLHCLLELDRLNRFADRRPLRILDLGCGPGTALLSSSLFFAHRSPKRALSLLGIDRSAEALAKAHELFDALAPKHHSLQCIRSSLVGGRLEALLEDGHFDLIIAANALNELSHPKHAEGLCRTLLLERLSAGGMLVLIEPALREPTRQLMALRDFLIRKAGAQTIAPCLHDKACPMLRANDRDWCHFSLAWPYPSFLEAFDRPAQMNHRYPKMAYLMLERAVASERKQPASHRPLAARVVSHPLASKGKRELLLCRQDGVIQRVRRLDREASAANHDFEVTERGDVVALPDVKRLGKTDSFTRVLPWQCSET